MSTLVRQLPRLATLFLNTRTFSRSKGNANLPEPAALMCFLYIDDRQTLRAESPNPTEFNVEIIIIARVKKTHYLH